MDQLYLESSERTPHCLAMFVGSEPKLLLPPPLQPVCNALKPDSNLDLRVYEIVSNMSAGAKGNKTDVYSQQH